MIKVPEFMKKTNPDLTPLFVGSEDFRNMWHICQAVDEIMSCPEARQMLLKAAKLANPKRHIPELDGPLK